MTYTREMVESLLPLKWDPDATWGKLDPLAPPQEMPKATPNKKEGSNLFAHLADINTGWDKTNLREQERQCILLRYGMDLSEKEIGHILQRPQQTVSYQLYAGVGKIVAQLNGDEFAEAEVC